jgi:hypothetical protein
MTSLVWRGSILASSAKNIAEALGSMSVQPCRNPYPLNSTLGELFRLDALSASPNLAGIGEAASQIWFCGFDHEFSLFGNFDCWEAADRGPPKVKDSVESSRPPPHLESRLPNPVGS